MKYFGQTVNITGGGTNMKTGTEKEVKDWLISQLQKNPQLKGFMGHITHAVSFEAKPVVFTPIADSADEGCATHNPPPIHKPNNGSGTLDY